MLSDGAQPDSWSLLGLWSLLVSTGLGWSLLISTGSLVSTVSTGLGWSLLVSTDLYWVSGLYWLLLVLTGKAQSANIGVSMA